MPTNPFDSLPLAVGLPDDDDDDEDYEDNESDNIDDDDDYVDINDEMHLV